MSCWLLQEGGAIVDSEVKVGPLFMKRDYAGQVRYAVFAFTSSPEYLFSVFLVFGKLMLSAAYNAFLILILSAVSGTPAPSVGLAIYPSSEYMPTQAKTAIGETSCGD
jgi:hypothetical protein